MTNLKPLAELVEEELPAFVEDKENPEEWYVLLGSHATDYSIWADEDLGDDYEVSQEELPPEDRDSNPNVPGYMQIGSSRWLSQCFDFDDGEDGFVTEAAWGDKVDRRLMHLLVVHESVLSEGALAIANGEQEPPEAER